jgi:HD superfamily phosphohydrolase
MNAFRQPQYLGDRDYPTLRVRCPIHGFIHFSENERQIIDHRLFRRLRRIRQLALTEYVHPGATHSRFEHSLGVMEVATQAFDSLASKRGDLMESKFAEVACFNGKNPLALARQSLRLAGLTHDIGHASFSHATEEAVHKGLGHEALSVAVTQGNLLGDLISGLYGQGCTDLVAQIIKGDELPPQLQVLHNIISGQMDFDRTDYLLRDSHHCGVDYGRFDYRRLIETLDLYEDESGALTIALDRGGIHTFEALILARYQMFAQVYHHRVRRIYDYYLDQYLTALGSEAPDTTEKVLTENDITMMSRLMVDAENGNEERKKWASRIRDRNHHRMIFETGLGIGKIMLDRVPSLFVALQERFPGIDIVKDIPKGPIHRTLLPDDMDEGDYVSMKLMQSGDVGCEVGEMSQVLGNVPREFRCVRIYADVDQKDRELRDDLADFAKRKWSELGGRS